MAKIKKQPYGESVYWRPAKAKIVLPAMVLIPSFYYSFSFTSGIVVGYILSKLFYNIFVQKGKVDSIFINFGKWKFHLHHWIMGVIVLAVVWIIDHFYLPTLFAGVICGVIVHDIYDFNDWYKVIFRDDSHKKNATA